MISIDPTPFPNLGVPDTNQPPTEDEWEYEYEQDEVDVSLTSHDLEVASTTTYLIADAR